MVLVLNPVVVVLVVLLTPRTGAVAQISRRQSYVTRWLVLVTIFAMSSYLRMILCYICCYDDLIMMMHIGIYVLAILLSFL